MFDFLRLPMAVLAWAFAIGAAACIALVITGVIVAMIGKKGKNKK